MEQSGLVRKRRAVLHWLWSAFLFAALPLLGQPSYDLLIRGAKVLDGAGNPWFLADVAVNGDCVVAVGRLGAARSRSVVEAKGLILAPGFIDAHSHSIRGIFLNPSAGNLIRQGVTTVMEGPDGSSPQPLRPFLEKLEATKIGINFGLLAGHGTMRSLVLGSANRHATPEEIGRMKELARQAMYDGAFGLSTGLFYVPGNYAPTEEVIELARVVAPLGGVHISHVRDEAAGILDSVRETIRIGEEGGLPTQLTHHKIIGKANWGKSAETIRLVEEARRRGVDVTIDQYPYTASSTGTAALFPQWALSGGSKALAERLSAPEQRARVKAEIVRRIIDDRGAGDPANIVMASCRFDPSLAGKHLAQITRDRGRELSIENAAETVIEIQLKGGCQAIYHAISEEDVERILRYPFTMIASDGGVVVFGKDVPHPRNYGTFVRVLGRYVRERKVLTLEEAVRRMTSFPAQRLGLNDRGILRPGMKADLVLFDPLTIADKSDFANPHQYAVGVQAVWVNGVAEFMNGEMTGQLAGRPLRGPAFQAK